MHIAHIRTDGIRQTCREHCIETAKYASEKLRDSPIVATTLVQFLNTLFGGKTSQIRRFSSLCDSIVSLDEVQSVPRKMLSVFGPAMNFLSEVCNTTIPLCSATQPTFNKLEHKMYISEKLF